MPFFQFKCLFFFPFVFSLFTFHKVKKEKKKIERESALVGREARSRVVSVVARVNAVRFRWPGGAAHT